MPEILPFTSYFNPESLTEAKMKGEQLRSMKSQRMQDEARQRAIMGMYGSPDEMYRQQLQQEQEAIKMKRLSAAGELSDSLYEEVKRSGFNKDVIKQIKERPDIKDAVSPLFDLSTWEPHEEGEDMVYMGEPMQATIDGKPATLNPKTPVTKLSDGTFKSRPLTAEDVRKIGATQPDAPSSSDVLSWDKAARDTIMKLVGTTTASGIVIDPERQQEVQLALSLLPKFKGKDINTASTEALNEAREIIRKASPNKEIARTGKDKKTGKRVIQYTDGTVEYLND